MAFVERSTLTRLMKADPETRIELIGFLAKELAYMTGTWSDFIDRVRKDD